MSETITIPLSKYNAMLKYIKALDDAISTRDSHHENLLKDIIRALQKKNAHLQDIIPCFTKHGVNVIHRKVTDEVILENIRFLNRTLYAGGE